MAAIAVARPPQGGRGLRATRRPGPDRRRCRSPSPGRARIASQTLKGMSCSTCGRSPSPGRARIASKSLTSIGAFTHEVARPPQGGRGLRATDANVMIAVLVSLALPRAGADCESCNHASVIGSPLVARPPQGGRGLRELTPGRASGGGVARPPQGGRGLRGRVAEMQEVLVVSLALPRAGADCEDLVARQNTVIESLALPRAGADCERSVSLRIPHTERRSPSPGRARIARAIGRWARGAGPGRSPSPGRARIARRQGRPRPRSASCRSPSPGRARIARRRRRCSIARSKRRSPSPGRARIASGGGGLVGAVGAGSLALPRAGADCEKSGRRPQALHLVARPPQGGRGLRGWETHPHWPEPCVARPPQGGRGLRAVRV